MGNEHFKNDENVLGVMATHGLTGSWGNATGIFGKTILADSAEWSLYRNVRDSSGSVLQWFAGHSIYWHF